MVSRPVAVILGVLNDRNAVDQETRSVQPGLLDGMKGATIDEQVVQRRIYVRRRTWLPSGDAVRGLFGYHSEHPYFEA
jgi:hypothetical protein